MNQEFAATSQKINAIRERISNVKLLPKGSGAYKSISFQLDQKPYFGNLRGRNEGLQLGFSELMDKGIAAIVFLDGDAVEIEYDPVDFFE